VSKTITEAQLAMALRTDWPSYSEERVRTWAAAIYAALPDGGLDVERLARVDALEAALRNIESALELGTYHLAMDMIRAALAVSGSQEPDSSSEEEAA